MPKVSKLKLPPLDLGEETLGQRIARLRKGRGISQVELAGKIGIVQVLISDYENDKLRPHYEMIIRIALALDVTADELLGMKKTASKEMKPDMKLVRRLKKIEGLPLAQRKALLKTIDTFLKGSEK
jgi:transcriptional regulator with XRE-family HTH domain